MGEGGRRSDEGIFDTRATGPLIRLSGTFSHAKGTGEGKYSNTFPKWEELPKTQTKKSPGNDTRCRMLAALNPETQTFHRIKWRQIVQASDGMGGDIGEMGGEVKFVEQTSSY